MRSGRDLTILSSSETFSTKISKYENKTDIFKQFCRKVLLLDKIVKSLPDRTKCFQCLTKHSPTGYGIDHFWTQCPRNSHADWPASLYKYPSTRSSITSCWTCWRKQLTSWLLPLKEQVLEQKVIWMQGSVQVRDKWDKVDTWLLKLTPNREVSGKPRSHRVKASVLSCYILVSYIFHGFVLHWSSSHWRSAYLVIGLVTDRWWSISSKVLIKCSQNSWTANYNSQIKV